MERVQQYIDGSATRWTDESIGLHRSIGLWPKTTSHVHRWIGHSMAPPTPPPAHRPPPPATVRRGRWQSLARCAAVNRIQIYIDGSASPWIDAGQFTCASIDLHRSNRKAVDMYIDGPPSSSSSSFSPRLLLLLLPFTSASSSYPSSSSSHH